MIVTEIKTIILQIGFNKHMYTKMSHVNICYHVHLYFQHLADVFYPVSYSYY